MLIICLIKDCFVPYMEKPNGVQVCVGCGPKSQKKDNTKEETKESYEMQNQNDTNKKPKSPTVQKRKQTKKPSRTLKITQKHNNKA